jgi:hypothetical protein
MLNLVDVQCRIESNSTLIATATLASAVSCDIEGDPALTVTAEVLSGAACTITSNSSMICNATVKPKQQPVFDDNVNNLGATYAIVYPDVNVKKYKYVEINFTFKRRKYKKEFFSDKEIGVVVDRIRLQSKEERLPIISLKKIEGLHGKTYHLQEQG